METQIANSERLFVAESVRDLDRCFPVMHELRPHLTREQFHLLYDEAHRRDDYRIAAIERDHDILAVMGYRILYDYVRGKHLYIDDLIVTEDERSKGWGARLLEFAEEKARANQCSCLRLCTGIKNHGGVRFYERNGWVKRAYAYVKK